MSSGDELPDELLEDGDELSDADDSDVTIDPVGEAGVGCGIVGVIGSGGMMPLDEFESISCNSCARTEFAATGAGASVGFAAGTSIGTAAGRTGNGLAAGPVGNPNNGCGFTLNSKNALRESRKPKRFALL